MAVREDTRGHARARSGCKCDYSSPKGVTDMIADVRADVSVLCPRKRGFSGFRRGLATFLQFGLVVFLALRCHAWSLAELRDEVVFGDHDGVLRASARDLVPRIEIDNDKPDRDAGECDGSRQVNSGASADE